MFVHKTKRDSRAIFLILLMVISSLSAGASSVSATTGYETISVNNVTNSSATVNSIYLDQTDTYLWTVDIVDSSGTIVDSDTGSIQGATSHMANAAWTTPTVAGTYLIEAELSIMGITSTILLDNTTSSFIITSSSNSTNGSGGGSTSTPTTHYVDIANMAFNPSNITINIGDSVKWTNNGSMPHTATESANTPALFDTGMLSTGNNATVLFTNTGTYNYVCQFHSSMTGVIIVQNNTNGTGGGGGTNNTTATGPNDAGTGGDLSNTAANALSFTIAGGYVTYTGSLNTTDTEDWLEFPLASTEGLAAELTFDIANDYDISLWDSTVATQLDNSWANNPESVTTNNSAGIAHGGSVYVQMSQFIGVGNWTLEVWIFTAPPPPAGDMYEPNDNAAAATPVMLAFGANNLSIHTATDEDYFEVNMISGTTYWANITFLHSIGDIDIKIEDSTGMQLAFAVSISDDETMSYTPSVNSTFYVVVYGYIGAINTYDILIEEDGSGGVVPVAGGDLYTTFFNSTAGEFYAENLTSNSNYYVQLHLTEWNGTAHTSLASLTQSWTQGNGTNYTYPVNITLTTGGVYCLVGYLYNNQNVLISSGQDCFDYELISVYSIDDFSALVLATNLSAGSYNITWTLYDTYGPNFTYAGNYVITVGSTGFNVTTINWPQPTPGIKCIYVEISEYNWTSGSPLFIDSDYDCFTPEYPDVTSTNLNTSDVYYDLFNLTIGYNYHVEVEVVETLNNTTYYQSQDVHAATGNNLTNLYFNWSTPLVDGHYCVILDLYDQSMLLVDTETSCMWIEYDDDGDGVTNLNDLCPGTPVNSTVDLDGCALSQIDTDGDGFTDDIDVFPNDSTEWMDSDGDGYGDNFADAFPTDPLEWMDSDGDGYGDNSDAFPMDPTEWEDTDGDGYGDNSDAFPNDSTEWMDSDGDGWGDNGDAFPTDPTEWFDTDGDGYGDNAQDEFPNDPNEWVDSDGDGWGDNGDPFPNDPTQWFDTDGDGYGDNATGNNPDAFPNDSSEWADSDGDGHGDNFDDIFPQDPTEWADSDGDGYGDNSDVFPNDSTEWMDSDGDGYGNNSDVFPNDSTEWMDSDGDGWGDNSDAFPTDATQWSDFDGDGYGDNLTGTEYDEYPLEPTQHKDSDGDGYGDNELGDNGDLCPDTPSGAEVDSDGCSISQRDSDGDGVSDLDDVCAGFDDNVDADQDGIADGCDDLVDSDGDGVSDLVDVCAGFDDNVDTDQDGIADGCDNIVDSDGDGVSDLDDVCDGFNDNVDADQDGIADGCDDLVDSDGDGVSNLDDVCAGFDDNVDADQDGIADGCDDLVDSDGDGLPNHLDEFPNDANETRDSDGDGYGDNSDVFPNDSTEWMDSDGDGYGDNTDDAFPDDPSEWSDTDGDGVGDNSDDYPTNAQLTTVASEGSKESSNMWTTIGLISLIVIVLTLVLGAVVTRGKGTKLDETTEINYSNDYYDDQGYTMEEPKQEARQWVDESGYHWSQQEDGTLMWWDEASGEWKLHQ